jgi:hypothetical protein
MPDLTPRPIDSGLEPTQPRVISTGDLIARIAGDLTPVQSLRISRKIQRSRMKTCVELARIQDETMLAQTRVIARAKVRSTVEQTEGLLNDERMDLVAKGAVKYEETSRMTSLVTDEGAHALFAEGLKGVSARYINEVIGRIGK